MLTIISPPIVGNVCDFTTGVCSPVELSVQPEKRFPYVNTKASVQQLFKALYRITHTGSDTVTVKGHNFVLHTKNSSYISAKSLSEFLVITTEILRVIALVEQKANLENVTVTFGDGCVVEITAFDHPENNMNAVVDQILARTVTPTVTFLTV